ncbi:MAG: VacJ family lipoprotein [Gallionellaceae bacterium]
MPTPIFRWFLFSASLLFGGCASSSHNPQDPFESFNRGVYRFNDTVDKAVVKPVAKGYNAVMPAPVRMMASSFFSNLNDVVIAANDLLQFKVVRAISDCGRIFVNSTVGLFGLVDVASRVGLNKHDEDFGQTLGVWGIGPGPYLVLPFLGPSTVRDGIGDYADSYLGPSKNVDNVVKRNELLATDMLNTRARLLSKESVLDEAMIDPYAFIRDAYLQNRLSRVYDGNPPRKKYEDEEDNDPPDKSPIKDNKTSGLSVVPEQARASMQTAPQ